MRTRGFTLLELMVVSSLSVVIAGAAGMFYYQARVSAARIEAQLQLQRQASLVAEFLAADLRAAQESRGSKTGIDLKTFDGEQIAYRLSPDGLVRARGASVMMLSGRMQSIKLTQKKGWREVRMRLLRKMPQGRNVQIERSFRVRGRR